MLHVPISLSQGMTPSPKHITLHQHSTVLVGVNALAGYMRALRLSPILMRWTATKYDVAVMLGHAGLRCLCTHQCNAGEATVPSCPAVLITSQLVLSDSPVLQN